MKEKRALGELMRQGVYLTLKIILVVSKKFIQTYNNHIAYS